MSQCQEESNAICSSSHVQLELHQHHTSGKLCEKSSVLSSRLKAGRVVDKITSAGRAFQTCAAMTEKAQSPTVDSHNIGMAKASEDYDHNCCLDGRSLTLCSSVDKYVGARP